MQRIPGFGDRVPCGDCENGVWIFASMHAYHEGKCLRWHHSLTSNCGYRNRCLEELPENARIEEYSVGVKNHHER